MNRYDFTQPGGFPLDQGVLDFIQACIGTAAATAALAGPFAILSGCAVTGSTVGNGMVVINGEILPFIGGAIQTKVKIVETATVVVYQDAVPRTVKFERTASFGDDGVTTLLWANFKRDTGIGVLARLDSLEFLPPRVTALEGLPARVTVLEVLPARVTALEGLPARVADLETLPSRVTTLEGLIARVNRCEGLLLPFSGAGGMVWWKGAVNAIPAGWREVAEWRGRLPMAYDPADTDFAIGNNGGAKGVKMTLANLIEHDHDQRQTRTDNVGPQLEVNHMSSGSGRGLYYEIIKTGKAGSANPTPINVLNPYHVGCWIEPIPGTF